MNFDPSKFHHPAVVDTCAVWNILSSRRLYLATHSPKVNFYITPMVEYECISKPRKEIDDLQRELISRFQAARSSGQFPSHSCDLEDLLTIGQMAPISLSSGELSCIAVAYKLRSVSFMTDEKKARKFAQSIPIPVETTPRLYGWLHYQMRLVDGDHSNVLAEHEKFEKRPITAFFNEAYEAALRARALDNQT